MISLICIKCKTENPEGSIFCNKCGAKLTDPNNNENINNTITEQKKNSFINKVIVNLKSINIKAKIISGIIISLIIILCIGYAIIKPPSPKQVFNKIKGYKADDEISYINKVYPTNGGFLGMFKKRNRQNKLIVLNLIISNVKTNFQNTYGISLDDYNAVEIKKVEINHKSYSSDYVDIVVTVYNGGSTPINYIKINFDYKDVNGNIIRSDWTNDNSEIKPGASQIITNMTKEDGWDSVHAEIAEIC